jgi:hypothetical protein
MKHSIDPGQGSNADPDREPECRSNAGSNARGRCSNMGPVVMACACKDRMPLAGMQSSLSVESGSTLSFRSYAGIEVRICSMRWFRDHLIIVSSLGPRCQSSACSRAWSSLAAARSVLLEVSISTIERAGRVRVRVSPLFILRFLSPYFLIYSWLVALYVYMSISCLSIVIRYLFTIIYHYLLFVYYLLFTIYVLLWFSS